MVPRCHSCHRRFWYDRPFCPHCGSLDVGHEQHAGDGIIYSYTIVRKNSAPGAPETPYVLAYVELTDGPRMLAVVHANDRGAVQVGHAVSLANAAGVPEFVITAAVQPDSSN
jgi:uncharacterized OB-fold protein